MNIQTTDQINATTAPIIIADRAELTCAINTVINVVQRRNTIPVLSNVRIKGNGTSLTLTATDLDIEISTMIACAADSRFDSTIPALELQKFTKKAPKSEYVSLTQNLDDESESISLDFEKVRYNLEAIKASDFPSHPDNGHDFTTFLIDGEWLNQTFASLIPAVSTEETRYYLNGVFMHVLGDELVFVATDGHKLLKRTMPLPEKAKDMPPMIVPLKAIKLIEKLTKKHKEEHSIQISASDSNAFFEFNGIKIKTKVIDGTFPDYTRVIPQDNKNNLKVDAKTLIDTVDAVSIVSGQKGRAVRFELLHGEDQIALTCRANEGNTATADIAANYDGEPMIAGFNSAYIPMIIKAISNGETVINMAFRDPGAPCLITSNTSDFIGVLMPMRV